MAEAACAASEQASAAAASGASAGVASAAHARKPRRVSIILTSRQFCCLYLVTLGLVTLCVNPVILRRPREARPSKDGRPRWAPQESKGHHSGRRPSRLG